MWIVNSLLTVEHYSLFISDNIVIIINTTINNFQGVFYEHDSNSNDKFQIHEGLCTKSFCQPVYSDLCL